jgi:hypothetical protein
MARGQASRSRQKPGSTHPYLLALVEPHRSMKTLVAVIVVAGAAAGLTTAAAEKVDFVKDVQPGLQQNSPTIR